MYPNILWPENKKFAFSIFDDTDRANLDDNKIVYNFLNELGFKTTKSVWVTDGTTHDKSLGITCDDQKYLSWLFDLKSKGFEIGFHNVSYDSSVRKKTKEGLENFVKIFDQFPNVMANHSENRENIYWGADRLSGTRKSIYKILTFFKKNRYYQGHQESSPYFWGDLCKKYVTYVRNFVFSDINTLKCCPYMPYKDPAKPYVNYWYASTEGNNLKTFTKCLSDKNQDRLEKEGGACIMYTHFADDFCKNGKLSEKFKKQMIRLKKKDGWFVPASTLLDFLKKENKNEIINKKQKSILERKWLLDKLLMGST